MTFLDNMKIEINNHVQERKMVSEYEAGFNQIVCFVPHVAHANAEKAR